MSHPRSSARRSAVYLLDQVLGEGRLLSELIPSGALDRLDPADKARAQRLATETLRGLERADRMLQKHLRKQPPLTIRNILRLAVVELAQGGDAHGVVNEAVALAAGTRRTGHLKGLVNAVLRKVANDTPEHWALLRVPRLPKWLRSPLVDAYGPQNVAAMEAAHFKGAPLDVSLKAGADHWADKLGGKTLPTGSIRIETPGQVSALPGFAEGAWWVQDAAAALPVQLLDPRPDERVLDLCAAPGGKTLQIAAGGAAVTSVDSSRTRMLRVDENLARTGLTAKTVVADALEFQSEPFDAILLDAPCSATGTIRRHPDLPHAKDGSEFGALIELQAAMLDHAVTLLKPGGRIVFCTCSLLPDEGECQIDEALERHAELTVDRAPLRRDGIDPDWITEEGGLRLRPDYWADQGGMDGFYMAVLRKG